MIETIKPGRKVTLAMRNGRLLTGRYRGLEGPATGEGTGRQGKIVIESPNRYLIPLSDVVQVQVHGGNAKLTGFVIGAIVDAVIIIAALDGPPPPPPCGPETTPCYTSCPFVYSFDGEKYVLDTEVFGGALFEAAQRTDRASLQHLEEAAGAYRLRLTNELEEIQHVDAVKLLVVDHPPGTRVVPSLDGRLHTLTAPVAPERAEDLRGADVRGLVAGDGGGWLSNPLAHDRPGDGRDGVVLEFRRPPDASAVTLAFRAQSTQWASVMLRRMLGLHGRDQQAWTERMNADASARGAFLGALRREGLLTIRVWDGATWREAGVLANMAEAVTRDQAVRVDLASIPGDVLRVRLDAAAGLWILRRAEADFSAPVPLRLTSVSPTAVRTAAGDDIRDELLAVDGVRYTMHPGAESADLAFDAPPRAAGMERSHLVEATGYYTVLVPAEGEPQTDLYETLVGTPGAFGRYAAELVRNASRRHAAQSDVGHAQ
jgi:hypothetical protein